ncbi:AAA family ATPase [Microcoleus sp. A003_D6]|uniref:trifunctional serine/threonine-protein kinase/ATP-binding protein/sensor histidine kinase n=1 Tax=Microcoleus sp. A003_D6 TaxID=3055266 RepID=UPI002FD6D987
MLTLRAIALSDYDITEQLYSGSRTLVYRAVRKANQQPVVIKLLLQEHPTFSELVQFRNQYTITKHLSSIGIIQAYSLEPYRNGYALVMEDFGGISLRQFALGKPLGLHVFCPIALQISDILHDLYRNRIVHKDIKLANILINPDTKQVKLIDFSIASLLPRETPEIQSPNILEGTLAYLSPEQTGRMNRGIDYRSDFYSLGVTFFELLTGQLPFGSDDPMELVHCHIAKQPPFVCDLNPDLPLMLGEIVRKLMAKNAEDRYQSALGLKHDLVTCLEQWRETGKHTCFELGQRDISDRFLIPEKLYGRESEVQTLLEAFGHVANGASELMLVAGFSGIGKTAVVNEVHKPIVRQRGYFIKGKFDQFNRNIPLSAFVQAFRDLMGQLLSESDAQLAQWRTAIQAALGENAQVIIDVVPELTRIMGEQPPVAELSGSAAQNRFNLLFQKFIQVFTTSEHPLVMFLDDLQWADSVSLSLMQVLMSQREAGYLLSIGAYRDNEVSPAHPLMLTLEELNKASATVNTITLAPLSQESLSALVADTLQCVTAIAQTLSQLIYQKTKGNPFFAAQFLKALHGEGYIAFDPQVGHWQCDLTQVRSLSITDNVVEFMALQLQKLPAQTQDILKLAACIGNQFDLATLAIVSEQSETETAANLWKALQEGLVLPQSEVYKFYHDSESLSGDRSLVEGQQQTTASYKFLHDRVQQAAYSLIPDDQKQQTHLKIGQLLFSAISQTGKDEKIFEIVNQLNKGADLIGLETEREELAKLNLAAAQKAKSATAYLAASEYATKGIQLLGANCWQQCYDITLALHDLAAEVACLSGDFKQMEQIVDEVLQNARQLLDKVKVYEVRILADVAQSHQPQAIKTALSALKLFGVVFPEQPTNADNTQTLQETQDLLKGRDVADLLELPKMTDLQALAVMRILATVTAAVYQAVPELLPLIVCKQVQLSVEYGNAAVSAQTYAWYGVILCDLGEIDLGDRVGQLAMELLSRFHNREFKASTINMVYPFVKPWKHHIQESLAPLLDGYHSGLEMGTLEYAAYCVYNYCSLSFFLGKDLSILEPEMRIYSQALAQLKQEVAHNYLRVFYQSVLNLLAQSSCSWEVKGAIYDEEIMLPLHQKANDLYAMGTLYINKLILCCLFNEWDQAIKVSAFAKQYLNGVSGCFMVPVFHFYNSLTYLATLPNTQGREWDCLPQEVVDNQKKLKQWANHAPTNHLHKFYLVEAEQYRVLGQMYEAMDYYDRAIASAKEHGYIQEEALANELAAKFYLNWGKQPIAEAYMTQAYYGYARWGAKAKVADLERRYPQLLALILQQTRSLFSTNETIFALGSVTSTSSGTSSSSSVSVALDLATILKASQIISGEIELEKLVSSLLSLVIENAGADKCVLMLVQDDRLLIKGSMAVGTEPVVLQRLPIEDSQDIPLRLIYKVKHERQTAVLLDVTTDRTLASDPYIIRQQPCSILCSPILHQGKLLGILYLENNLATGAFTSDRVELMNMLCAQAAISLENARLYQQVQQALEDAKLMQFSIDRVTAPVCWVEPDARISYANDAFCRDIGYSRSEILSKYLYDLNPDFSIEGWSDHWQSIDRQGSATFESRMRNSEGICYPVEVTINHITFNEKEYHLTFAVNISDRKRAELAILQKSQELEQALQDLQNAQLQIVQSEKMSALGNLVAGVAHEINNPVGFIAGNLQPALDYVKDTFGLIDLYQQEYPNPSAVIQDEIEAIELDYLREDLPKLIGSMQLGVDRIRSISATLRTFSRADKDYKVPFNIHEGIDSTILILKHRLKASESRPAIEVVTDYGSIPAISCFPGQLNQVFMNIMANAIDALEEASQKRTFGDIAANPNRIEIQTGLDDSGQQAIVRIRDNGMGMSDEVKQRVFEHLFTTKAVGKGTGLGLAIAHQIVVEKHGGTISVNSAPDKGTEFLIALPI